MTKAELEEKISILLFYKNDYISNRHRRRQCTAPRKAAVFFDTNAICKNDYVYSGETARNPFLSYWLASRKKCVGR